jgi:hypothetical protein
VSYTFGGATGDDVTWSSSTTIGAASRVAFVAGWWKPTTLTAGRTLWSAGNVLSAAIHSTTSELVLTVDNATTDGTWTTTGAGLTVGTWTFLAFLLNTSSAPGAAWTVWSGTDLVAPAQCTITAGTAMSGALTGNATSYVGNKGTGSVAFQGQVENVVFGVSAAGAGSAVNPFAIAAFGTTTAAEALWIEERLVRPIWQGEHAAAKRLGVFAGAWDWSYLPFSGPLFAVERFICSRASVNPRVAPTVNGATVSAERGPRPDGFGTWSAPFAPRR